MRIYKLLILACLPMLVACSVSKKAGEMFTPEETSLNMVKITDENTGSIIGPVINLKSRLTLSSFPTLNNLVGNAKAHIMWPNKMFLDISPDGTRVAYMSEEKGVANVMIRSVSSRSNAVTQRTFRDVYDFSWGSDGKIYFTDISSESRIIASISSEQGNLITQLTNGQVMDKNPVTLDGNIVYFTRANVKYGPSIWAVNLSDGTLTSCSSGSMPCPIPGKPGAYYCVRNSSQGRSEIWYVDYVNGEEVLILSDESLAFSHPRLSPDGQWILCQGNSVRTKKKATNLDIFIVRTDGTRLTQLTYSPAQDFNPVFSPDGQYIYFISSRGNDKQRYNVWRMNARF